jgi:antirestriction protein ArdC
MRAEDITARIIAQLEKGVIPWRKPWSIAGHGPTSLQTGKPYRGINALLLSLYAAEGGFDSHLWITYKQAQALGGNDRKGEKGFPVVFWRKVEGEDRKTGEERSFMLMRHFTVFHVSQCDGITIPDRFAPKPRAWSDSEALDRIAAGYVGGPAIPYATQDDAYYLPADAYYLPAQDRIILPPRDAFPTLAGYAETLLHEMTHSTGHASRLGRFSEEEGPSHFGSPNYAREELVAEIGAMMMMGEAGIEPDLAQGAAYIGGWLRALENDSRLIITAAQRAAKATALILGKDGEEIAEAA